MPMQDITTTVRSNLLPQITATTTTVSTSDRLIMPTSTTMTTTTTTTATTLSQLPLQQNSSLTPSSFKLKEQPQPAPINIAPRLTRKNMESDRPFPTAPQPTAPPYDAAPSATTELSKRHLPPVLATPLMPIRSRLERLIHNIHDNTIELWMPDAVYQRSVRHLSKEQDLPLAQPTNHANSTPSLLENTPNHTNNSRLADYATRPYNPAFDIHPKLSDCRQKCYQHHSRLTNSGTTPYNPAFDLHPSLTNHGQNCHQQCTQLSLAPPVQGFAQNKRPP